MQQAINELETKAQQAKTASRRLAFLSTKIKNQALIDIAKSLISRQDEILAANEQDCKEAQACGMGAAMLDRLLLNPSRLEGVASDGRAVAALPDPVGEIFDMRTLPNGLQIGRQRVPLGAI